MSTEPTSNGRRANADTGEIPCRAVPVDLATVPLFPRGHGQALEDAFIETLGEVREALHRHGRLSSRHEALDELAKLVFAHFISLENGGDGVTGVTPRQDESALALSRFVEEQFRLNLPPSVAHEFGADEFRLRLKHTEERLARDLIESFRPLSPARVGKHSAVARNADLLNDTFGRFLADSFTDEKELGQYLTPTEVIQSMTRIGLASLTAEDHASLINPSAPGDPGIILDPSCGVGSFLAEAVRQLLPEVERRHSRDVAREWLGSMMKDRVVGFDKSERMLKLAMTSLALFGAPSVNLHLVNSLSLAGRDAEITKSFRGRAKLILTNPPFGAEFSGSDLKGYAVGKVLASSDRTAASELLFLERYLEWLAPGGVLVAVVPDSVLTNKGVFREVRDWMAPQVELCSVISLPPVTFGAAGTTTKTSVLHLRKRSFPCERNRVYVAICSDLGFTVVSRGAQRRKVRHGDGELPAITDEATRAASPSLGRMVEFSTGAARWDATYHAGLPDWLQRSLDAHSGELIRVGDVADLIDPRHDPRKARGETFQYIEISDVVSRDCSVHAKEVARVEAPSRARRLVQAGDVLVSTVRPERRAVGAVPAHLDGAICSTGLAVLRPRAGLNATLLARVMQSEFVTHQLLRNNIGIAYPAIDEECLPEIVLPLTRDQVAELVAVSEEVDQLRAAVRESESRLQQSLSSASLKWMHSAQT